MISTQVPKYVLLFFLTLFLPRLSAQKISVHSYGDVFKAVQMEEVFTDQKKFVDCPAKVSPDSIRKAFNLMHDQAGFNLKDFVGTYFDTIPHDTTSMIRHIHDLWNDLTREPDDEKGYSTLIPLPSSYIVPGGRFTEIYYWDSYFTMLGLQEDNRVDMMQNMVDNFAYLIQQFGHIPNGNRTYYLSRSQPPFFALMVELLADTFQDDTVLTTYLPALEKEYSFWMTGEKLVNVDGGHLNRYWDALNTPRPESYKHDVMLAKVTGRDSSIYRDIRSAAESGWDFSSRWFADGKQMKTIETTAFIPVDLNCLLYNLETTIARAYRMQQKQQKAKFYTKSAAQRKKLILKYCWNDEQKFFADYNTKTGAQSKQLTLAAMFPLYFNIATQEQSQNVKSKIESQFLMPGGLVTTLATESGQQWDYPNAWAPLQWIAYQGLRNYNYNELAREVALRWTNLNIKVFFETGKMMEKYDVVDLTRQSGGGEYATQDGFGWTNGVFLKFWNELHK